MLHMFCPEIKVTPGHEPGIVVTRDEVVAFGGTATHIGGIVDTPAEESDESLVVGHDVYHGPQPVLSYEFIKIIFSSRHDCFSARHRKKGVHGGRI